MKKIISVLCAVAMIAAIACVGVFADDAPVFTAKIVLDDVKPGATEVTGSVVGNLASGSLQCFGLLMSWDDTAMALASCKKGVADGTYQFSKEVTVNPYSILWVSIDTNESAGEDDALKASSPDAPVNVAYGVDYVIAKLSFTLNAPAEDGQVITVNLVNDEENPAAALDDSPVAIAVEGGSTTVAAEVVTTAPATDAPKTDAPATDAPKTDAPATDAPKTDAPATEAPATDAPATTANNNNGSAQTGDMMLVVAILMVVALGAAVVVKKVNAK